MNIGRIFLSGIVAGLIIDVVETVVYGVLLRGRWEQAMQELGRDSWGTGDIILFWIVGLAFGLALAWLYAAIRPRYGPGPKTAIWAGLYLWIVGTLLVTIASVPMGIWPGDLLIIGLIVSLVEFLIAALVAGYLYREEAPAAYREEPARP